MKAETVAALHDFTLEAREWLEKEIGEQLEGIYGLLPNGKLEPPEKYPALKELPEAKETRTRLEQFLEDEKAAGVNTKQARDKLRREAAFTWLNRLVAFKMMESRGLIRQTITKGPESRAFLLWLTEPGNETDYEKYEQGDLPQNALGEGPRQEAYRNFFLWQCGQLAQEIRVLFDSDNLASRLFPRPLALSELIKKMNAPDLQQAWVAGNEESIGWVYQFFNEKEKKEVFDKLYKKKQKIRKEDIPAATELFTPNWIVTWLVHNSLGRYWLQMHPDSNLADRLPYLVPSAGTMPAVPLKKAKHIRLLDPACGTMHFGLVAFDLFVEMYREELEMAGSPGWPESPSLSDERQIPAAIIGNNIYGLDIDLRAIQLSALALYLKAKSMNKEIDITESHLGCADVLQFDDAKLSLFLKRLNLTDSIYARVLKGLWEELTDLGQAGSLLRFEAKLQKLIAEEKTKFQSEREKPHLPGFSPDQFETEAGESEFWEIIETQIVQALHFFAKDQAEQGRDESFFASETVKGFQVLDIMTRRYDVVATNPPYMARRNMNAVMAKVLQKDYPNSKGDLYTAFIERCAEFLGNNGQLAMITQQSFMFISSYEKMRRELLDGYAIESMCHVGPRAFDAISGEKVNTTLFVLRRESDAASRKEAVGAYFRLVKEPDGESKRRRFEEALARLKSGEKEPIVYRYRQGDFDAIPGSPWVYWITPGLRRLFETLPKLEEIAQPRQGLATADNFRFLRYWWEVGEQNIGFGYRDAQTAQASGKKWFPYMKGGSFQRWYGNQEYVVKWRNDGAEIRNLGIESGKVASRPQNTDFYFCRGVTWSDLTSGRFSARLSPGGFIFDVKGSSAFPKNLQLVIGLLNSSFAHYALNLVNPTVSFQVGDLSRIPIPNVSSANSNSMVDQAIDLAKSHGTEDETKYDFIAPAYWRTGIEDLEEQAKRLAEIEGRIDEEIYRLYGISDEDRKAIEEELAEGGVADSDSEDAINELSEDLAKQWISYAVGIVMGRFEPGVEKALGRGRFPSETPAQLRALADPDAILVIDEGHTDDLPAKVLQALAIMVGDEVATEVVKAATGKEGPAEELLRQYLERTFFKVHIQQYRKRPVCWFLQSPKKKYGVWLFHERMNKDTLFRIRTEYVDYKINLLEGHIAELREKRDAAEGREKRKLEKEIGALNDVLDDIREFSKRLEYIIEERGYVPHVDDGVLLNMAPLWELIPSWQKEPKKAWEALERGDYDWSYQAMDHWPERVREKCKTNRSYAIAHGLG